MIDQPTETDEAIAIRVQKGDIDAFGILIARYEQKMNRYAKRFLFDSEESKDLIQDLFIKAYVNIQSFDAERRFSPWIYRIAHNVLINAGKKKSRSLLSSFDPDLLLPMHAEAETPETEAVKKEVRAMLDKGLAKISPKYREPLVLHYFEELGYQEIADVLQIPISTVGVRLKRGREALKKEVGTKKSIHGTE